MIDKRKTQLEHACRRLERASADYALKQESERSKKVRLTVNQLADCQEKALYLVDKATELQDESEIQKEGESVKATLSSIDVADLAKRIVEEEHKKPEDDVPTAMHRLKMQVMLDKAAAAAQREAQKQVKHREKVLLKQLKQQQKDAGDPNLTPYPLKLIPRHPSMLMP